MVKQLVDLRRRFRLFNIMGQDYTTIFVAIASGFLLRKSGPWGCDACKLKISPERKGRNAIAARYGQCAGSLGLVGHTLRQNDNVFFAWCLSLIPGSGPYTLFCQTTFNRKAWLQIQHPSDVRGFFGAKVLDFNTGAEVVLWLEIAVSAEVCPCFYVQAPSACAFVAPEKRLEQGLSQGRIALNFVYRVAEFKRGTCIHKWCLCDAAASFWTCNGHVIGRRERTFETTTGGWLEVWANCWDEFAS